MAIGEPLAIAIRIPKPKPSWIDLYRDHFSSVSAESDSVIAEASQYSTSQILRHFTSHRITFEHTVSLRRIDLGYLMPVKTTKNEPIKLAPLPGTQELATPDVVYQPWCIKYPQLEPAQTYELKYGLIHLLPKFHGFSREDPHKHLKEFHVVCSTMRPQGISEDYIKMKAFPFSLDGAANDWLYL
ncbi:hypothetical protein CR513_36297, partial [Mucuna pruriens]